MFRRPRQESTLPPEPDLSPPADTVVMRFLTRGGATVVVVERERPKYGERFGWVCLGCETIGPSAEEVAGYVRDRANRHAGECRAMPQPVA
jgi:hypothetical protein